jgi:hypothetical protein
MSKEVSLFFMYRTFGGGTTSYTVHLAKAFMRAGIKVFIYRVKERGEEGHIRRPFAKYDGIKYRNITATQALAKVRQRPALMTAPCNSKYLPFAPTIITDLMKEGMRIVIHDPNEFEIYDHLDGKKWKFKHQPFCIRPSMLNFFPKAHFIPHPYIREYDWIGDTPPHDKRPHLAVSVARVTFVKRTEIILEANKILREEGFEKDQVVLRGAENRLYTRFKLQKLFPEFKQGGTGYPMTWGASARECAKGVFALDFTLFPDDGGGSQYSFMEAWDAGTVNIIHKDWMRKSGEMNPHPNDRAKGNCIAVSSAREAADWLMLYRKSRRWREDCVDIAGNGERTLERYHDPVKVANQYWEELNR